MMHFILIISTVFFYGYGQFNVLAVKGSYLSETPANREQLSVSFYDIGQDQFNQQFQQSACPIIRRECSDCIGDHQRIYYRRLQDQTTFEPWSYFLDNWLSHRNIINTDFELYNNWFDAMYRSEKTKWTFCDYDDRGVGFPRNCGKSGSTGDEWNTFYSGSIGGGRQNIRYALYTGTCNNKWTPLAIKSNFYLTRYGKTNNVHTYNVDFFSEPDTTFNNLVETSPTIAACGWVIIRRECLNCEYDHKDIYYKRIQNFDFDYHEMLTYWTQNENNNKEDFELYSTFEDALFNPNNKWNNCIYDDPNGNVGFPRDCGPNALNGNKQWNSYYSDRSDGQSDTAFTLYVGGCNGY